MRVHAISCLLLFALLVFKEVQPGDAKTNYIRGRGLKGSSLQRTTLSESDTDNGRRFQKDFDAGNSVSTSNPTTQIDEDDDFPPCTHYYSNRKSKFNRYDDNVLEIEGY